MSSTESTADESEVSEYLTDGPAQALAGLLGVSAPDRGDGPDGDAAVLPLLWHLVYLLDRRAQAELGPDGHPMVGGVPSPPGQGRRRMFAGGRVRSLAPLRCGRPATRRARMLRSEDKVGRRGPMTFATAAVEIVQDGIVVVSEEQDIVYQAAATGQNAAEPEPGESTPPVEKQAGDWEFEIDPVLLFRFSALTYNAHRIHYDRAYARDVEGYSGLVVHGPLQAVLMAEAARARLGARAPITTCEFEYRLVSPLFDHQGLWVRMAESEGGLGTQVLDRYGRETARGRFTVSA